LFRRKNFFGFRTRTQRYKENEKKGCPHNIIVLVKFLTNLIIKMEYDE